MVYTIGEALIDMIPSVKGKSLRTAEEFSKQAGGAPANTAATIAKLKGKACFLSKLGNDGFGRYIADVLKDTGVDVSKIVFTDRHFTGIIYIALNEEGDREFCALRQNSADLYLDKDEIDSEWFTEDDILHFCSVSLVEAPVKYAHIKAIESVIAAGGRISFDINLRLMLWKSREECLFTIWDFLKYPDYLKVSEDEIEIIFGNRDYDIAASRFFEKGQRLIFIILSYGSDGADIYFRQGAKYHIDAFESEAVDTTGAGDCFIGSILYHLDKMKREPNEKEMTAIIRFASAAAALMIRKKGAIASLPTIEEVNDFLNFHK